MIDGMVKHGVVRNVIFTLNTGHDATGQEQRRYWDCGAREQLELLPPDDVREILLDAIGTPELTTWLVYPEWFGAVEPEYLPSIRGRAVKLYPDFARWHPALAPDEVALLERLLDDPQPVVRHFAATTLAQHADGPVAAKTVVRLIDAIADRDWIWSYRDHWDDSSSGCNAAAAAAANLGEAALAAVPAINQLIVRESGPEAGGSTERRLERLREAVLRLERSV